MAKLKLVRWIQMIIQCQKFRNLVPMGLFGNMALNSKVQYIY